MVTLETGGETVKTISSGEVWLLVHSVFHVPIQQIFTKHLLCFTHDSGAGDILMNDKVPAIMELTFSCVYTIKVMNK